MLKEYDKFIMFRKGHGLTAASKFGIKHMKKYHPELKAYVWCPKEGTYKRV